MRDEANNDVIPLDGCSDHPTCLTCPFETCRYDMSPEAFRVLRRRHRDRERVAIIETESLTAEQAAARFGVTKRTVVRMVRRAREELKL